MLLQPFEKLSPSPFHGELCAYNSRNVSEHFCWTITTLDLRKIDALKKYGLCERLCVLKMMDDRNYGFEIIEANKLICLQLAVTKRKYVHCINFVNRNTLLLLGEANCSIIPPCEVRNHVFATLKVLTTFKPRSTDHGSAAHYSNSTEFVAQVGHQWIFWKKNQRIDRADESISLSPQ